ncbi:MAG: hypothetical protein IT371_16280 [Deltaproteobacteria bacterium]|nr:hypothetical protein [Deltaproteobacteria bacterium]
MARRRREKAMQKAIYLTTVLALAAGCATPGDGARCRTPADATRPPAAAARPAEPPSPSAAPDEALLDGVPGSALGLAVLNRAMLAGPTTSLLQGAALRSALSSYLVRAVGVDLSAVDGLVAYVVAFEPRPRFAVIARVPGLGKGAALKAPSAGNHRGVPLARLDDGLVAAIAPTGVLLGEREAVEQGIDVSQKRRPGLAAGTTLAAVRRELTSDVLLLAALDMPSAKELAAVTQQLGLQLALLRVRQSRRGTSLQVDVDGDPQRMAGAAQLLGGGMKMAESLLRKRMETATNGANVAEGVAAILGYYHAVGFLEEAAPKVNGGRLTSSYVLPRLEGPIGLMAVAGVLAAVAVPAFIKYLRRAKAVEAKESLASLQRATAAHYAAGRKKGARYAFPTSTGWAPEKPCCGAGDQKKCPGGKEAFAHQSFRALDFALTEPHYYQYRITSTGRGKRAAITLEARGDLNCNGKPSSYKVQGKLDAKGELEFGELEAIDPLE